MPSFHSAGTLPVDHTLVMTLCKASLIGFSAPFRSSAVMLSAPAARPFFNRRIALVTSCNIGTSSETITSGVAESAKSSRSAEGVKIFAERNLLSRVLLNCTRQKCVFGCCQQHWPSLSSFSSTWRSNGVQKHGSRSFAVSGPRVWNNHPPTFRASSTTLDQFQSGLKTTLFRLANGIWLGTFVIV